MITLDSEIQLVKGVGPKVAKYLNKCGITSLESLFYYFPREYDDRRKLPYISELKLNQQVTLVGQIDSIHEKKVNARISVLECSISDRSGSVTAVWFNQGYLKNVLKIQKKVVLKGKVERNLFSATTKLIVSDTEVIYSDQDYKESVGLVIPIYNLTAGLYQLQIRRLIKSCFNQFQHLLEDFMMSDIIQKYKFIDLKTAIKQIHFPDSVDGYKQGKRRIVFDEFFVYQCRLQQQRQGFKRDIKAEPLRLTGQLTTHYLNQLPYTLTGAQQRCIQEIKEDCLKSQAMNRLLQGDVGAGKTDVAVMTLLMALESNKSGVLMAPTEILAFQHYLKCAQQLEEIGIDVLLLKGKMRKKEKQAVLDRLACPTPVILIGTHALIEEYVSLANVGVVIIDEQHRFGVLQRSKLQKKGSHPHCLYMTATPIPRSFMLTCFGDLDKSIMDEMPPGRIPPETVHVKEGFLPQIYAKCTQKLTKGFQLYIVYPLVEESEKLDLKSAVEGAEVVQSIYPDFVVGLLHGRLHPEEKQKIMAKFKSKEIHILVATTVIEVGIDVPNATMMIIQDAERFGLSQLHQLRGRIGRGGNKSDCYLVSSAKTDNAKERLKAMVKTANGFEIAEYDLKIRGPGDILGTRQSGLPDFNLADLVKDEIVLQYARKEAMNLFDNDLKINKQMNVKLQKKINQMQVLPQSQLLN